MLRIVSNMKELNFSALCDIYQEYLQELAQTQYRTAAPSSAILLARQDFYQYLRESFFSVQDAVYAIWNENGQDVSALRLEPYRDGYLLTALETLPDARQKGYAKSLVEESLSWLSEGFTGKVYSHIAKDNSASLKVHIHCGFQIVSNSARFLDGSFSKKSYTLQLQIPIVNDVET